MKCMMRAFIYKGLRESKFERLGVYGWPEKTLGIVALSTLNTVVFKKLKGLIYNIELYGLKVL